MEQPPGDGPTAAPLRWRRWLLDDDVLRGDELDRGLDPAAEALAGQLAEARRIMHAAGVRPPLAPATPALSEEFERFRWFPLPDERDCRGADRRPAPPLVVSP